MDGWVNGWLAGCLRDGCIDGWMDGCADGWVNGWMAGWGGWLAGVDGWLMDRWMDSWMGRLYSCGTDVFIQLCIYSCPSFSRSLNQLLSCLRRYKLYNGQWYNGIYGE